MDGELDWKKMRSMKLKKFDDALHYKNSHTDEEYMTVLLPRKSKNMRSTGLPARVYGGPNAISKRKYEDLMFLCKNVVTNEENRSFYEQLPHSDAH